MDDRTANNQIAEKAEQLRVFSRVPMMCECGAPGCRTIVMIALVDHREIRRDPNNFLTAPGHEIEGTQLHEEDPHYTVRRANRDRRSASHRWVLLGDTEAVGS